MAIQKYQTFRKGRTYTLPAADSSISGGIIGIKISDAATTKILNEQSQGNAVVFTASDNNTRLPHQIIREDWPATLDGAWSWYSRPESVSHLGYTYWFPINQFGEFKICWLKHSDRTTGEILIETLSGGTGSGVDDHNNGAAIILQSGKLLVFYAEHNGNVLKCVKQSFAGNPNLWDSPLSIESTNQTSYVIPIQLSATSGSDGGDIYIFYRDTTSSYQRRYKKSTDGGVTWGSAVSLFQSPNNATRTSSISRPYLHATANRAGNKIWFLLSDGNPPEVTHTVNGSFINSLYVCYFDNTTGKLHQPDGTQIGTDTFAAPPASGFDTWDITKVYDGTGGIPYWNWDIQMDLNDQPCIGGIRFFGDTNRYSDANYIFARWNGSTWIKSELSGPNIGLSGSSTPIGVGGPEPWYHGGIALDPDNPSDRLFISWPNINNATGSWNIHEVKSTDNGATWKTNRILNTTRGNERKCIRPIIPRHYSEKDMLCLWMEGHYRNFQLTFTGSGSSFQSDRFATGIQTFPRVHDGYVAFVKLDLTNSPQTIHMYWDRALNQSDESNEPLVYSGWLEYPRDIHWHVWDTGRTIDMTSDTEFTVISISKWARNSYNSSQHTYISNWVSGSTASILMREQSSTGNNVALLWNTTSGTFGNTAWSTSPAVQIWNVAAGRWDNAVSSGQLRPMLNGSALTSINGSAAAMPATISTNNVWLGYSPHTNVNIFFNGYMPFAGIVGSDMTDDWIEEFTESNPFSESWSYAIAGNIQEWGEKYLQITTNNTILIIPVTGGQ